MIKIIKKILVILLIFTCLLFFLRNQIIRFTAQTYLRNKIDPSISIEKVYLSHKKIGIYTLKYRKNSDEINFTGELEFKFSNNSFKIGRLRIKDTSIDIENMDLFINKLLQKDNAEDGSHSDKYSEIKAYLENIVLDFSKNETLFGKEIPFIKKADFTINVIKNKFIILKQLDVNKTINDFNITIDKFSIKGRDLKNIVSIIRILDNKILVSKFKTISFGNKFSLSATVGINENNLITLNTLVNDISFSAIFRFFLGEKDNIEVDGLFSGNLDVIFENNSSPDLSGVLKNHNGGYININNDIPVKFLQSYLDQTQYETFIDGFKNYNYNKASVFISTIEQEYIAHMLFESNDRGSRNIPLHYKILK